MSALARPLARREGGARPGAGLVLVAGMLNFAVSYGIVYQVETVLPSGLVCVLWGVFPMMTAFFGHLWLPGERLAARQGLGFAVGFAGVVLLFATDVAALGQASVPAALVLLASPLSSAVGQVVLKRRAGRVSSVLLNRGALVVAATCLLGASLLTERDLPVRFTARAWASLAYLSVVGTVVTFGLYFWLLRSASSSRLSLIAYVTPAVALWLGVRFGGESIRPTTLVGTALIVSGIGLVTRRPRARGAAGAAAAAERPRGR
jgi:drug/metabolite transporter (DMT)-like permease